MAHRLATSTSPYLLQHAHNPVDWWEWGEGAFTEARQRNRPIFLSIGYAACHWCHVMAHESFEDEMVAELLTAIDSAWDEQEEQVRASGRAVVEALTGAVDDRDGTRRALRQRPAAAGVCAPVAGRWTPAGRRDRPSPRRARGPGDRRLPAGLVADRLRRSSRAGRVGAAQAVAEDYGDLVEGLVALHGATADQVWLTAAGHLLKDAVERFGDGQGLFHDTASDAEQLVLRPRARGDNAEPCGQSALAGALLLHGAAAGSAEHLAPAARALEPMGRIARRDPRFAGWALAVGEAALAGPLQVAISEGTGQQELAATARDVVGALVITGRPGAHPPLLEGRPGVGGRAAAYVCWGTVCDLPVTSTEELRAALAPDTGPERSVSPA